VSVPVFVWKKPRGPSVFVELNLDGTLALALINAAAVRKRRPVDLLADIIERVLLDDLVKAVLDD
jgi:uncharacterized membrane protein YhfC